MNGWDEESPGLYRRGELVAAEDVQGWVVWSPDVAEVAGEGETLGDALYNLVCNCESLMTDLLHLKMSAEQIN